MIDNNFGEKYSIDGVVKDYSKDMAIFFKRG